MAGYKYTQLKNKSFEEIQMLFDKEMKRVNSFVPMDSEVVKGSGKKTESSRKETVSKKRAEIVPRDDEAVNVESLSTKYPIVDWKTHILAEDKMLVKEIFEIASPEGYDRLLWGDLITLFEPKRKYPLTQEMLSRMLSRRLEVDHECEKAYELLRFTRSQLKKLLLLVIVSTTGEDCKKYSKLLLLLVVKLLLLVLVTTARRVSVKKLSNVALRMFTRRVVILKWVENLQLGIESYQKKLNITKPETLRLMRLDELYKFCDGTLSSVQRVLHDIASSLEMDYLPKRIWSKLDRKRSRIMIKEIDQQLFKKRLMRNLEKFVGGREYGNDFRLLERTI
ncbi:hypothetical protein Tco_1459343 [Tanacetum coccineum]